MLTHEQWIAEVATIATGRASLTDEEAKRFSGVKLAYGYGPGGALGITYHRAWGGNGADKEAHPFVELCAGLERSTAELAGTTIHELAHAILGPGHGHGKEWKVMAERLGLRRPRAVANRKPDGWARLTPDVRFAVARLAEPDDGKRAAQQLVFAGPRGGKVKPCGAGAGSRGGKSRGPGSGSRLRLFECECDPPVKVRASRDDLAATCDDCGQGFARA